MSAHTPGLWRSKCVGHGTTIEPSIAWVGYGTAHSKAEHKANADLMAASPKLLDAAVKLLRGFEYLLGPKADEDPVIIEARAAISEATGFKP